MRPRRRRRPRLGAHDGVRPGLGEGESTQLVDERRAPCREQASGGRELERRRIVSLDASVGRKRHQVRVAGDVQPQERGRFQNRDGCEVGRNALTFPRGRQRAEPRRGLALARTDQQHVALADEPEARPGEHGDERGDNGCEVRRTQLVRVGPLTEQPAGSEAVTRRGERLPREERRDAGHPQVGRFRDHDVVSLAAEPQMCSAVTDQQPVAPVEQRAVVGGGEERRRPNDFR